MESMESKIPPRPGIILPLSFTPQERLKTDSIKSPIIDAIAVINAIIETFRYEQVTISENKNLNKHAAAIELNIPPINPTRLLFGLEAKTPLVLLPNKIPKNQAKESQIKTMIKNKLTTYFEFGKIEILDKNVIRNPV